MSQESSRWLGAVVHNCAGNAEKYERIWEGKDMGEEKKREESSLCFGVLI